MPIQEFFQYWDLKLLGCSVPVFLVLSKFMIIWSWDFRCLFHQVQNSKILWFYNSFINIFFFSTTSLWGAVPRARDSVKTTLVCPSMADGDRGKHMGMYDTQLCYADSSVMQGQQPSHLGRLVSRNGFPGETGESILTRKGGAGVHCVLSGENSKCKGTGVRERGRGHGISGERKRGWCELV